jgi:ABC-2 type transport system ATP-binding protein
MSYTPLVKATSLTYRYSKEITTLTDINITIEKGCIYGFLGPNGSGKTTTLSLLLGLLDVQEGHVEIFGKPLTSDRIGILKKIGSLIESPSLYGHLTAKENLEVYRGLYGASKERVEEVLKIVGLGDTGKKKAKSFSLGMRQRLSIALALLPRPELLILDEPANGLDPTGIIELRELIKKLNREEGMTIIISSHILAEVEKMVTHIGIISKGRMLFQGPLQELYLYQQRETQLHIHTSNNEAASQLLQHYKPVIKGDALFIPYNDQGQIAAINRLLIYNDLDVFLLQPKEQNLEQLFIHLTTSQS